MATNKITWEQFAVCNNDARGVRYKFEDLCRQLFVYEFLSGNKKQCHIHSNPNNTGLESEPVYDEVNQRWIGYQVKYFDNNVNYTQIQHSIDKIVEYYKDKVDHVYIFCNKAVTTTCGSYKKIIATLGTANITAELITDTTILDMVRKYHNLGLYYFEQHTVNKDWIEHHKKDIFAKLGERYDKIFNVETRTALYLSLFVRDASAIAYINNKKTKILESLREMDYKYDSFDGYKDKLKKIVENIPDVTSETILDSLDWDGIVKDALSEELTIYNAEIDKIKKEREKLHASLQEIKDQTKRSEILYKDTQLRDKIEIYETLIKLSQFLSLSNTEISLIEANILTIKGKAGVGKSHLLANETEKIIEDNHYAIMLLGGDYLASNSIIEQISSDISSNYSFFDMLEILNVEGEIANYIVPVFIDAINETWNKNLWKNALPVIFNKIRELKHVRLVISFRSEYQKTLIDENELVKDDVCTLIHDGFSEESFEATKIFLNHYGIPFTPLHMFNKAITNPLFLTLYCKTYRGDEVDLPVLYERLIEVANSNIHKNMSQALATAGYDLSDDVVTPIILDLADFTNLTGKRYFSINEISDLPIWKTNGINLRPMIRNLIRENILHNYMYDDEERLYFSYDQMNDYFCAKAILSHFSSKEELISYIEKNILGVIDTETIKIENQELFIYICALFSEKYGEECIDIIDEIKDEYEREIFFEAYLDSFQWRKSNNISIDKLLEMCSKYNAQPDKVWGMFITNSLKICNNFNADALHKILLSYSLNRRDYIWTMYINGLEMDSENRLIQLIQMYNEGNGLDITEKKQLELLLTLFCWLLTASSRWLRDMTSKAMVELLKLNFEMAEVLLRKFQAVNDSYVIQRLYGIIWGACVKRENEEKAVYDSLALYVYKTVFMAETVYPDILLRDYARLIIERYLYEYPEKKKDYSQKLIEPPYTSEIIPEIEDQGYLKNDYEKGMLCLIQSMKFASHGLYGDFGSYVFESALNDFDVNHNQIFNYAIYYIINELGYDNELFGEYDSNLEMYNYNRFDTVKVERIGKKYQWIAMYNILARISDHCVMRDRFSSEDSIQKYEGPWEPYVRDFDPSINEYSMANTDMPIFEDIKENEAIYKKEDEKILGSLQEENKWVEEYPKFFDFQKDDLIISDSNGVDWVVLVKYADTRKGKSYKDKLQIWNWIYGYFVTDEQYRILKKLAEENVDMINNEITWIPETYSTLIREYPWAPGSKDFNKLAYKTVEIRTGKKKIVTGTHSVPDFSGIERLLKLYSGERDDVSEFQITMKEENFTKEIDETESIGEILCAAVNFLWEEEFDASKKENLSWYAPCAEIIEKLKLQYGKSDGAFYDQHGNIAAFDTRLSKQNGGLVIRKDLLEAFIEKSKLHFIWFVRASKEIHSSDLSIRKYSDWSGMLSYENGKAIGEIFNIRVGGY